MKIGKPEVAHKEALDACEPFRGLGRHVVEEMFGLMEERSYDPGEYLMRQGDPGDCLLVIVEGRARAVVRGREGARDELATFGTGEVVGEMALVTREPRSADIVADSRVSALALPAEAFHAMAGRNLELGMVLTNLIADRLGQSARDGLGDKVVHGYRILRCIGRGGMSVVYEAECDETRERLALKMMSHRLVYETGALARFRQEADLVRQFEHPNIAKIHEHFPAYNTEFLAMELCEGPTLTDLVRKGGALREPVVQAVMGQLACALEYVHAQGVVHRDVKPSNVILTPDGVAKLMDFGVAQPNYGSGDRTRTAPHTLLGTPAYMPPEQLGGDSVDPRADVYGLACLGYELAMGKPPFDGTTLMELIQQKLSFRLPPAEAFGRGIGEELHDFLERGMQNEADDRPDSLAPIVDWAAPVKP